MNYDTSLGWVDFNNYIRRNTNHILYWLTYTPVNNLTSGDIGLIQWLQHFGSTLNDDNDRYLFDLDSDEVIHDFLIFNHLLEQNERTYKPDPDRIKLDHYIDILIELSFEYLDRVLKESPSKVKLRFYNLCNDIIKFIKRLESEKQKPDYSKVTGYESKTSEFKYQLLKHKMLATPGINIRYN